MFEEGEQGGGGEHLRDRGDVTLARRPPPAQLLVEEAAEDVTALGHGAAHSLQEDVPGGGAQRHSSPKAPPACDWQEPHSNEILTDLR